MLKFETHVPVLLSVAGTAVVTVVLTATLLLYDWKAGNGHATVFDDVRPLLRSALGRVFGSKASDKEASRRPSDP